MKLPDNSELFNVLKHFCDTLWEYDIINRRVYVYHDSMTPAFEGSWHQFDQLSQFYKQTFLTKLDLPIWDQYMSHEKLKEFSLSGEKSLNFSIRFHKDGSKISWHDAFIEKLDENRLMISSRNIYDDVRNQAIGKAVETEFDYVAYIDVKTGGYILYHSTAGANEPMPPLFYENYHKILYEYNAQYVVENENDALSKAMEIDHVIKELESKPEYVLFITMHDEQGQLSYKKLRFCYLNDEKNVILLSRIDVSDITREHNMRLDAERREIQQQKKLVRYLDHMPIAHCMTKILLDETGKPQDFVFTYSNYAHAALEKTEYGELIGKSFYQFFKNTSPLWLDYYYDTAYNGTPHTLDDYSPEVDKHLVIDTYQPEFGYCGCIVRDVTEQKHLEQEVERTHQQIQSLLEAASDFSFQYYPHENYLFAIGKEKAGAQTICSVEDILDQEYIPCLKQAAAQLANGLSKVEFRAKGHIGADPCSRWYEVSLFDFHDYISEKNQILGYMKDINDFMVQQESLQKEADQDPLTGIFNAKSGKQRIEKILSAESNGLYRMMLIMDIDDFKTINDTKGHQAGDQAIVQFAQLLKHTFRQNDIYYRLGGDEFVAFVCNMPDCREVAESIMRRFFQGLSHITVDGIQLTSSIGIFSSTRTHTFEEFYKNADQALYQSKCAGKNQYTLHCDDQ